MLQPLWLPRSPASFIRVFFQLFCHQVCYQGVLQNIFNRRSAIILKGRNYQQVTLQPRNIMARDSLARPTRGRNQLRAIQQKTNSEHEWGQAASRGRCQQILEPTLCISPCTGVLKDPHLSQVLVTALLSHAKLFSTLPSHLCGPGHILAM